MAYDAHSGDLPDFHLCCQKVHVYICACVARTCISLLIGLLIKLLALAVGHHDAAVICLNSFFDSVELQQPLSSRSRIHLQARGGRASSTIPPPLRIYHVQASRCTCSDTEIDMV